MKMVQQEVSENGKALNAGESGVLSVSYYDGKAYICIGSGKYLLQVKKIKFNSCNEVFSLNFFVI